MARIPKNYSGNQRTSRSIQEILPKVLESVTKNFEAGGEVILNAWPQVIGERFGPYTEAVSFRRGILKVKVRNSTLLSLLKEHEKGTLQSNFKKLFPNLLIKDIHFTMG